MERFLFSECVFHACFMLIGSWKGRKNLGVRIFFSRNWLGSGYRKQTTFLRPKLSEATKEQMQTLENIICF